MEIETNNDAPATATPPQHALPASGGPPMSGPPMSGPPMSGPPMSGPPMSGPPMSGPPMSGPPMSGPPMSGPPMSGPSGGPIGSGPPPGIAPPSGPLLGSRGPPPPRPNGRPPPLMATRIPPPVGIGGPRGPPPGGFHGYPGGPRDNGPQRFPQQMGGPSGAMNIPPHSQQMGGPSDNFGGGGGGGPMGQSTGHMPGPDLIEDTWIETKTAEGKSYFYHAKTRETVWTKPENVRVVSQAEFEEMVRQNAAKQTGGGAGPMGPQSSSGFGGPSQSSFPPANSGFPPGMMPPSSSGGSGWPPAFPPPFLGSMPPFGMPMGPGAGPAPDNTWMEYTSPEGRPYYFNTLTGETTWDKPQALKDREAGKAPLNGGAASGMAKPAAVEKVTVAAVASTVGLSAVGAQDGGQRSQVEQQQKSDTSKPISNNPVAGTPWCVVWTGDHKVFFYNPSTRASVWERPLELYGRPDVDLLVSKPPEPKKVEKKGESPDSSPMLEEEVEKQPPKKKKKGKGGVTEPKLPVDPAKFKLPVAKPEPPAPKVRDAAMEAEVKAAQERAQIPLDVRIQQFKDMLREKDVSAFSTWEKELHKIVFDSRYLLLTSKERKNLFEQYVKDRAEEERAERKKKAKEAKDNFKSLLLEASLDGKSPFSEFSSKYGKDDRFKGIEKSKDRESMFHDFVGELRKKEREEKAAMREKQKIDFLELLKEQEGIRKYSKWSEVKKTIHDDPRYKVIDSSSLREDWFKEYLKALPSADSDDEEEEARKERLKQKDKQEREEAAQRAREEEVAAELESQMKERDKEMEKHKFQESEENFKALLADLVKTTEQSWRECKRHLRKDHRWESADLLDRHQKEQLFEEHINMLEHKKREAFYQLLDETSIVTLTSSWKEVKKVIKEDPRLPKFSSSDRKCEREFREYLQEKLIAAKNDFRDLLKETKIITYKSKQMIQENEQHLKDILAVLENDKRYLVLECVPDEREKLLESYLDELDKRGPPPPPTASEPSRRVK